MGSATPRISPFYSLKTQLCAGAILLLAVTLGSISYFLIEDKKNILHNEIEKTIVFQGRNIALSRNMPWRNIWSPSTPDGSSFVSRLMIRGWPTVIVLDAQGRLRYRFSNSPLRSSHSTADVEKAVRILLDEMKTPEGTSP